MRDNSMLSLFAHLLINITGIFCSDRMVKTLESMVILPNITTLLSILKGTRLSADCGDFISRDGPSTMR
ncbi:MAG: hypothetical protein Fur0020_01740 [Thermodesulfovibrionia bacterium]